MVRREFGKKKEEGHKEEEVLTLRTQRKELTKEEEQSDKEEDIPAQLAAREQSKE